MSDNQPSNLTCVIDQSADRPRSYGRILKLQRTWADGLAEDRLPQLIWLGSHKPVITLGRRAEISELKVEPDRLSDLDVELHTIERGGLATCHGPGQLVCYPILRIDPVRLGVKRLVSIIEAAAINMLAGLGIEAGTDERNPGVWVGDSKVGFIGLAIQRHISFHGLAVNLNAGPELFDLIVPCGLTDVGVVSAAGLLGGPVDMGRAGRLLVEGLARALDLRLEPLSLVEAEKMVGV